MTWGASLYLPPDSVSSAISSTIFSSGATVSSTSSITSVTRPVWLSWALSTATNMAVMYRRNNDSTYLCKILYILSTTTKPGYIRHCQQWLTWLICILSTAVSLTVMSTISDGQPGCYEYSQQPIFLYGLYCVIYVKFYLISLIKTLHTVKTWQ